MTRLTPTLTGRETSFARGKWRPRDPCALVRRFYRGDTALSGRDYRLIVYRAGSDLLGRIGILVLTVTAARRLAPEAFGIFALGTTLGWLATVASDAGMQMHVARSVAARPASAAGLLHQWLRCRLLASLLVMTLVAVGIAAAGLPWPQRTPLVLLTIAGLANGLVELVHHAFRGFGRTDLESGISLGQRIASLVLGLAILWWRPDVTLLALVLIVPPLVPDSSRKSASATVSTAS